MKKGRQGLGLHEKRFSHYPPGLAGFVAGQRKRADQEEGRGRGAGHLQGEEGEGKKSLIPIKG